MASRKKRAAIAKETVEILEQGFYEHPSGTRVTIKEQLEAAKQSTQLYDQDDFNLNASVKRSSFDTIIEVTNETTFNATRRLVSEDPASKVIALNFASAKNPGGGFLGGSQAQEECLARASGLYATLITKWDYYATNRVCGTSLYTERMIYSPNVPVFRDDNDEFLEEPYCVSILTSPAVNAGAVTKNERGKASKIEPVMINRSANVLAAAANHGYRRIVLGAWGCGVFRNEPNLVARYFAKHLTGNGRFAGAFERVQFAVLDTAAKPSTFEAFATAFG